MSHKFESARLMIRRIPYLLLILALGGVWFVFAVSKESGAEVKDASAVESVSKDEQSSQLKETESLLPPIDINREGDDHEPEPEVESALDLAWWEQPNLISSLRLEFLDFVLTYDRGWEEMSEIADTHLENSLIESGILLEWVRLEESDFQTLSSGEKASAVTVLSKIAAHRIKLGIDPFGTRGPEAQWKLENKILSKGLAYSPSYMIDALTYKSGGITLSEIDREEFSEIRKKYLLEEIALQEQIETRKTAALVFMVAKDPDLLTRYGFMKGLDSLDPERGRLQLAQEDLALRYREHAQRFLLNVD